MLFTAFLFIVLMSYISVAFLFDAPDNEGETLRLGKMVQDVYFLNEETKDFEFYLMKSSEYSFVDSINWNLENGFIGSKNCSVDGRFVLYLTKECTIDFEELVINSENNVSHIFDDYLKNYPLEVDSNSFLLNANIMNDKLLLYVDAVDKIEFSNEKTNLWIKPSFEILVEQNWSSLSVVGEQLSKNYGCLVNAPSSNFVGDIDSEKINNEIDSCFSEEYSEISKDSGKVRFNFNLKDLYLGRIVEVPFEVSLKDINPITSIS